MEAKEHFHGSDLEKIAEYYQIAPETIIKFGANVNPLGISTTVKEKLIQNLDIISSYPDRDYLSLKKAISAYCGASPDHIAVGNGSTELISLLISQRHPKKALVLGPTYSEYERELGLSGGTISYYNLKEPCDFVLDMQDLRDNLPDGTELIILCNPNNPTSSALSCQDIEVLLKASKERGIFVMIDETYVEFAPDISEITAVPLTDVYDNLMVIRGVSKFYAAPGLRFGYGITSNEAFLQALLTHQNPWSLNSIGAFAGELMLKDTDYFQRTRSLICSERDRLYKILLQMPGVKVYKPYGNFILVRLLKPGISSFDMFEAAIKKHMMIRDCSSFESLQGEYIRFCIMLPEDNDRLMKCIRDCIGDGVK
ncbi:MAG TPA: threonine-phosphate decarboxylase [Lachnospiraceae bacterium]|nr:threonine-phosphate decarboxylase [Lachnospiraceae bacterium]